METKNLSKVSLSISVRRLNRSAMQWLQQGFAAFGILAGAGSAGAQQAYSAGAGGAGGQARKVAGLLFAAA